MAKKGSNMRMAEDAIQRNEVMEKKKILAKSSTSLSISEAFFVQLICGLGLALAFWIARYIYSIDLVSDPSTTLLLIWVIECPIVILLYSRYRQDREQCSYLRAVGRGILGIPAGAIINAFGAIVLGAPVGVQYFTKTLNWSIVMSLFTIVPSACVFGSSWVDWQRLFAYTKPTGTLEHMICLPAHGAIIGAWFGAWPMPLDWDRPWQIFLTSNVVGSDGYPVRLVEEWPICVSYGALFGYSTAIVASLGIQVARNHLQNVKRD